MNKILVVNPDKKFGKFEKNIKQTALKALKLLNKNKFFLEIYLIGNQKMRLLNKRFRGKNKTTNILSFKEPKNFPHPELKSKKAGKLKPAGEIYLNMSAVSSQQSVIYLLIHGLLHLFGYEHQGKNGRIKMERKEKFLISHI